MNELVASYTELPNLHPALVHFPLALLPVALGFDLAALFGRGREWLGSSALVLYVLAALGGWAARQTGEQAADSLVGVPPAAQGAIAQHSDAAERAVWVLTLLAVAALALRLWRRRRPAAGFDPLRLFPVGVALVALALLLQTADRGGALVFRHGLAVAVAPSGPGAQAGTAAPHAGHAPSSGAPISGESALPGAETPSGPAADRLVQRADGSLEWRPLPADRDALGEVLAAPPGETLEAVAWSPPEPGARGLALEVSGRSLLLLPPSFGDVQVDLELATGSFSGRLGVLHHFSDAGSYGYFTVGPGGEAVLGRREGGEDRVLNQAAADPLREAAPVVLAVSAAGRHLKGLVDGRTVTHGHAPPLPPGRTGILLDGTGRLEILAARVTPIG